MIAFLRSFAIIRALEPWYDWGRILSVPSLNDDRQADMPFFTFEWLGFHLHIQVGRYPAHDAEGQ